MTFAKYSVLKICLCVFLAAHVNDVFAQAESSKIVILIKDVETPDTRASMGKYIDVKREAVPYSSSALTDADRASLDPEFLGEIRKDEVRDRIAQQRAEREEVERRNRKKEDIADKLRDQFIGTDAGRNIIQAKEWLAESLGDYSEFIQIVDRSEQDSTMTETALNATDQTARGGVTHIMRIIVGDVKEKKTTTSAYGTTTVQLRKSLNVSIAINDLNDRQIYSKYSMAKLAVYRLLMETPRSMMTMKSCFAPLLLKLVMP